ncbi:platelet-activating factor acetylhydrolase domain containing protein [Nitzschia inconspicua]|uniref:Platelet-activating factor acetylhydrolase domain containing protein n=1 Tax=Nitzschia inconspicua TaxID=303405 RepID=A0A9K3PRL9_9STRA|nr:platelet-activating factor acetylhydrolase domain containing protein [Nitzschia inconspicua]
MVLWGGLRPIISQVVADVFTLFAFSNAIASKPSNRSWALKGAAAGVTIAYSGNLTNRWTVNFPMIPLIILQTLRLFIPEDKHRWISRILFAFSALLIFASACLSILFPAVELAPMKSLGDYNVGVVDLYLPVKLHFTSPFADTQHVVPSEQDHATIRILYPTVEEPMSISYLRPHTSEVYCEENMKHSAPPPLRPYSWMIHGWRLIQVPAKHHATLASPPDNGFPVIFYSHGLGGSAEMYAYQTHALAAQGYVVVVLDHTDGSAPVVSRKDGTLLRRNETILEQWFNGLQDEYRLSRQTMTAYRAQELLAVVEGVLRLNYETLPELEESGLDFRNQLNSADIHYMGHSFGGATALHAAKYRPPRSVLAHDPASDWLPTESRLSLFDVGRMKESTVNHTYWTRGGTVAVSAMETEDNDEIEKSVTLSLHDTTELLLLFSEEWYSKKWSGSDVLKDMHDRKVLGPVGGKSHFGVIHGAFHQEFSDACMLTPLWIAREVGLTGLRNPLDTAKEIHVETSSFLRGLQG